MNNKEVRCFLRKKLKLSDEMLGYVMSELNSKCKAYIKDKDVFVKISHSKDNESFFYMKNEIKIHQNYEKFCVNIPQLVYEYDDPENRIGIIAHKIIDGEPLGIKRDAFSLMHEVKMESVIEEIEKIKELKTGIISLIGKVKSKIM